jgi:hypothetical protein
VSIHPYNEWRDPDDAWQDQWKQWSFLKGIPWIHQVMTDHGDGGKGVWLTEFGFSTCGQGDRWCVNDQQQAEYIKDSFRIARRWDYVKAALVYNLRNKGSDPTDREDQFGLLNRDFSPKPSFATFREAMAGYAGSDSATDTTTTTPPTTTPGTVDPAPVPEVVAPGGVTVGSDGVAPVPVKCKKGKRTCVGTITIQTTRAAVAPKGKKARRKASKRRVTLGSRHVRIKAGKRVVVRIRISRKHRRALARLGHVRVSVNASAKASATRKASTRKTAVTLRTARLRRYA